MSTNRAHSTTSPSTSGSSKLRLVISGAALGLLAMTGSIASAAAVDAAQAATTGRLASAGAQSGAGGSMALVAASSAPASMKPAVSGGAGGGGKGQRHATPKQIAWKMLRHFHWSSARQYPSLNRLWARESGWNVHALNPSSGAAGIPQAVPGSKMASAGPNWRTNATTQIRWGLRYIRDRYGSPRRAWNHEAQTGWY